MSDTQLGFTQLEFMRIETAEDRKTETLTVHRYVFHLHTTAYHKHKHKLTGVGHCRNQGIRQSSNVTTWQKS